MVLLRVARASLYNEGAVEKIKEDSEMKIKTTKSEGAWVVSTYVSRPTAVYGKQYWEPIKCPDGWFTLYPFGALKKLLTTKEQA